MRFLLVSFLLKIKQNKQTFLSTAKVLGQYWRRLCVRHQFFRFDAFKNIFASSSHCLFPRNTPCFVPSCCCTPQQAGYCALGIGIMKEQRFKSMLNEHHPQLLDTSAFATLRKDSPPHEVMNGLSSAGKDEKWATGEGGEHCALKDIDGKVSVIHHFKQVWRLPTF